MNTNFVVDEYALVWYLLFQASISEAVYKLKQKLWDTFKTEYNKTFNDRDAIITEKKDFIPNDETIYNFFFESKDYQKIKKQVEKHRLELMKIWDKNKKVMDEYNGLCLGGSESKQIYLTFDSGYEAGYTEKILDVLKENNVKATFFITGHYLNTQPDIVKRMIEEGHIVGNHTPNYLMSGIENV